MTCKRTVRNTTITHKDSQEKRPKRWDIEFQSMLSSRPINRWTKTVRSRLVMPQLLRTRELTALQNNRKITKKNGATGKRHDTKLDCWDFATNKHANRPENRDRMKAKMEQWNSTFTEANFILLCLI